MRATLGKNAERSKSYSHWKAYAAEGGGILDLQNNDIDYLRFLFKAQVETVCAFGGRLARKTVDAFDHSFANMRLKDGRVWDVTSSWIRPVDCPFIQNLELYGSEGYLVLDNPMSPPLTWYGRDGGISRIEPGGSNAVFAEIQHFVNCITHNENPSILTMKPVTLPLSE